MAEQRSVRLTTALGDKLRFRRMSGDEALDRPFLFEIELGSDDPAIELGDLLGTGMTVEIEVLGGGPRHFHGMVSRFAFAGYEGDEARYRATLRPWLWFLCRSADCRIFQEMTVPDIVRAIFDKHAGEQVHLEDRLTAAYAARTYCVQYRESDLAFVERLLQDEGISYFFVHAADRHTLVLADAPEAYETCPEYEEVPYYPKSELARRERDHVYRWDAGAEVRSGSYAHTSFDFEKTRADLLTRRDQPLAQAAWAEGELYDYSGCYTEPDAGERAASLRLEADQAEHRRCDGEGTAAGLAAGHRFTLTGYPRPDQNADYLLRAVEHEIWDPAWRSGQGGGEDVEVYRCKFVAMPADIPYRPSGTAPRPLIRGPQTAMVTGPAGEEIWTDKYGRVKLQFHWDREGKRDEKTSCWVRVSQAWAGPGFGAMVIPRIGQEVIVDFLEGDPDRPLVTGRVYNAQAMPPYGLPGSQNQSGLKSNSTKGGGGSNELMFDDTKGKEKVYFHAQYNMSTVVENDDELKVKNNRTVTIDGTHSETIKKDTTIIVSEGNYIHKVLTGTATIDIKGKVKETFQDAHETTVTQSITITSQSSCVHVKASTDIVLEVGASKLALYADGRIELSGKALAIKGTDAVNISGMSIKSEAGNDHSISGAIVISSGTVSNTVKGAMVMLNP